MMHSINQKLNPGNVHEYNMSVILSLVWDAGNPVSRTFLTRNLSFNKSTVGNIISELISLGYVREVGLVKPEIGRPALTVEINPSMGGIIGVEIGVGFLLVIATDYQGNIIWRNYSTETHKKVQLYKISQYDFIKYLEILIEKAINVLNDNHLTPLGIGIGIPGDVNISSGTLVKSLILGWRNLQIKDLFIDRFRIPVIIGNEAKVAAIGELLLGSAKKSRNFYYLGTSNGIGGTLVMNGNLLYGENGFAGEIGHMTIDPSGPLCICGKSGCLEAIVGPLAILNRVRQKAEEGHLPILMEQLNGDISRIDIDSLASAATNGEPEAVKIIEETGKIIGDFLSDLIYVLDPGLFIIGGSFCKFGELLKGHIVENLLKYDVMHNRKNVKVILSENGFDACAMGGVALVISESLKNPVTWRENILKPVLLG